MIDETNSNSPQSPEIGQIPVSQNDNSLDSAESPDVNASSVQKNVKNFKQIYIILVVIGLIIGGFVAWGVVIALNRLGLSDSQPQIEQIR